MRTRPPLFLLLSLIWILVSSEVASGQQPADIKPASPPKPAVENKPSPATAPQAVNASPMESAVGLYRSQEFSDAATAFGQIGQMGGADSPAAFAWLARADLKLSKLGEAEAAARKALSLSANLPTGHSALGEVYFREGKFADAEREFLTPLKAGIPDPRAYFGEARLSWMTANRNHCKKLIEKAHALDPQDPEIKAWWIRTLSRPNGFVVMGKDSPRANSTDLQPKPTSGGASEEPDGHASPEPSCRLVAPVTSTETPLERLMLNAQYFRGLGLAVKLNGTSSKLLLDTGASGITINTKLAERAGVRHVADMQFTGFGNEGAATGYIAYVESIQVGGLEFKGCRIHVLDRKRSMGEDGFIGADVFQDFLVDINFPDEKFSLSELPKPPGTAEQSVGLQSEESEPSRLRDRYLAPEMQSYERFYQIGHYILLPTLVNTTANARLFLVDTGAYENILSTDFARQVTKVHRDEFTTVRGISGKVKNVYRADGVKLGFANSRLMQEARDVVAQDLSDISDSAGTEVSGVIGFSLLWLLDVKIDYRDGLLHFSYEPNRIR